MAALKIEDISTEFKELLGKHMKAYHGKAIDKVLNAAFTETAEGSNVYQFTQEGGTFLNTVGSVHTYLFKDGANCIFCIAPKLDARPFSGYFPQMVPKTPWLSEAESKLPFPNLPSRKIPNIQWWYIYSTQTVTDSLKKLFFEYDYKDAKKPDGFEDMLASLMADDNSLDKKARLQGLFYFGTLPALPEKDMIPDFVKTAWGFVTENIGIQGNVYRYKLIPHLQLQIPILNPPKNFDGDVVKKLQFALALNSPLAAVNQTATVATKDAAPKLLSTAEPDKKDKDKKKPVLKQKRELDLTGKLFFAGDKDVKLKGFWPLDEDLLTISVEAELNKLDSYFEKSDLLQVIPIDTSLKAGITFKISKKDKKLNTLEFNAEVKNWQVAQDILVFENIKINCIVRNPGKVNMITAKFSASAKLGEGTGEETLRLLADGNYPKGTYNLYLDPKTPLTLPGLIKVFSPNDNLGITRTDAGAVVLSKLSGQYNSATNYFAFEVAATQNANLTADESGELNFQLSNLALGIYGKKGKYSFKLAAKFAYKLNEKQTLNFIGAASYDAGWYFNASYSKGDSAGVSLYDIASAFKLGTPPDKLNSVVFEELGLVFDSKAKAKQFAAKIKLTLFKRDLDIDLRVQKISDVTRFKGNFTTEINGKDASFTVEFLKTPAGDKLALQMAFRVADVDIYLAASNDKEEGELTGRQFFGGTRGLNLPLKDVLEKIINTVVPADLPNDLLPEIFLSDIYVLYNGLNKQVNLIALTEIDKRTLRFFIQYTPGEGKTPASYAFGVDTEIACFDQLPLVGEEMKDVVFSGVGFIYTSAAGSYTLPRLLVDEDDEEAVSTIELAEEAEYYKGLTIVGSIVPPNNEDPIPLSLPLSEQPARLTLGADGIYALDHVVKAGQPVTKWLNINKKMGPVTVSKLGFAYDDGRVSLLIAGALSLADMSVNVEGLGMSFSLPKLVKGKFIEPKFELNGLGLALKKDPLEISGMLLRAVPKEDERLSFYGAAQIKTSGFTIKGIGAYAKLKASEKPNLTPKQKAATDSMFIYGVYNGPIGGPSFFFVTGVAAGFGYNRTVKVPKLEEVPNFPLVAMALSGAKEPKSITDILKNLVDNDWIPSSAGDYWLALGIKFTSFNIIESFILVTVKFGNKLEFAVIGLSLLKWPNKGTALVYIELAVLAKFGPESDVIAVSGMLTPNSYLFHKDCKLTGGFAFYTWISGKHEGDFVISLGGYHPKFNKPDHYPTVDRLALNWKFSDALTLSGEMYFALTPSCLMAGGKWEVAYNLSFLSARVIVWADMFIQWAPFSYDMVAGIIVRIEANIKVLFVHIHFKLQMACVVHIWGPPFSGEIYVDWSIFSFTIGFGNGSKTPPPALTWSSDADRKQGLLTAGDSQGFKESFIPQKDGRDCLVEARIVGGLLNETKKGDKDDKKPEIDFINSYELVIAVDSFFPLDMVQTKLNPAAKRTLLGADAPLTTLPQSTLMEVAGQDAPVTIANRGKDFGIKPMKLDGFTAGLEVWLENEAGAVISNNIVIIANAKGVNDAMWGTKDNEEPVLQKAMTGVKLHAVKQDEPTSTALDLKEITNTIVAPDATVNLLSRKAAGSQVNISDQIEVILNTEKAAKEPVAAKVSAFFKSMNFDLTTTPDSLDYEDLMISEPKYLVSIGEVLPKKPQYVK